MAEILSVDINRFVENVQEDKMPIGNTFRAQHTKGGFYIYTNHYQTPLLAF